MKYMYGDGLSARSARYTSTGRAWNGTLSRCDGTTWNTSPARMYSLHFSTAAMKPSRVKPDSKSASDRKSTRLNSSTNAHLVCRLLLAKKKHQEQKHEATNHHDKKYI